MPLAAVLHAPRDLRIECRDLVPPRAGEVRLEVLKTGVCGTDLAVARDLVDLTRMVVDEVRLVGSRCGDTSQALAWLQTTTAPVLSLVAAEYPLERLSEAFEAALHAPKILVCPR